MRFNFDSLRLTPDKSVGLVGTVGSASNDKSLARPTSDFNCGALWGVDLLKQAKPQCSPHRPHIENSLKFSNDGLSPQAPQAPQQKAKLAPEQMSHSEPTAVPKAMHIVLTFELDGGRVTCLDALSTTLEQSIAELRQRFHGRVGRIWQQNIEVGIR